MYLLTSLLAVIASKVKTVVAEYRKLISEARDTEKKMIASVKTWTEQILEKAKAEEELLLHEARSVILEAQKKEKEVLGAVELQVKLLYNEVKHKFESI